MNTIKLYELIPVVAPIILVLLVCYPDIKRKKIPNAITFPAIGLAAVYVAIFATQDIKVYSILAVALILLLGFLGLMPMGDVKMFLAIALFTAATPPTVYIIMASTYVFAGLYMLIRHSIEFRVGLTALLYKIKRNDALRIPVAPFCLAACIVNIPIYMLMQGWL